MKLIFWDIFYSHVSTKIELKAWKMLQSNIFKSPIEQTGDHKVVKAKIPHGVNKLVYHRLM